MDLNIAPGLLIAMPTLADPNFFRSVVLMCAHNAEGGFGLVINHELDMPVQTICQESEIEWAGDDTQRVLCGGPVEPQRGWLLHPDALSFEGTQTVADGLCLTTSQDGLKAYGKNPSGPFRLMLGYAGWGPNQLESEIQHGSWLTVPLKTNLIFDTPRAHIWAEALRSVGVEPAHLVDAGSHLN